MPLRKKILVVEDNMFNREILSEILSSSYQVLQAENGQEALDVLGQYGEEISLILLDIIMPIMDGYTFLSIAKEDPVFSSIPVIVATQSDGESDEVAALAHGATDFVTKPYKPQIILHRVASIIHLRETASMINLLQYDRLTGIYSKGFFYQKAADLLRQNPETQYDVLCSNVEHFKLINDVFGTQTGDLLLCRIADIYQRMAKEHGGICGRLNTDRFVCVLEHAEYTDAMFEAIVEELSQQVNAGKLSLKWGLYGVEDRSLPIEQICDRALLAEQSIKGQYNKNFAWYDNKLRSKLLHDQMMTDCMETALLENQFQVYLQPKYRIKDETLAGAEALVRWIHPEWGFQSPGVFIPLFEQNGFITRLDQYMWDSTCAILREWMDKGYEPVPVSVNVSRADIYNVDLPNILSGIIEKYNLSPAQLHLEITESAYTENPSQIINTVTELRRRGFIIEMDDFGSGYSSLNMFNDLPIDILKLDMKFIQSETTKPSTRGILQFIISLAQWMNLSVVAEGVETREQLDRLRSIGCDYVQGYYFAKPMPWKEFASLFAHDQQDQAQAHENKQRYCAEDMNHILLIADEDSHYRASVRAELEDTYDIVEMPDGGELVPYVTQNRHRIAAILLSLTLPEADSFALLSQLKREHITWDIPVLATGLQDEVSEGRALELGAEDFIAKPHWMRSLARRLQRASMIAGHQHQQKGCWQDMSCQDYQTGVLNRHGLEVSMDWVEHQRASVAVYMFALDEATSEDAVLAEFGQLLSKQTRKDDVVAHISEGEFVVAIKSIASPEAALERGQHICAAIRQIEPRLSCSAGVTIMQSGHEVLAEAILRAGKALRHAQDAQQSSCSMCYIDD